MSKIDINGTIYSFDAGSDVSITPSIGSGTKVADYTIDGTSGSVYVPSTLASYTDDSTHRLVTDAEKATWNGKQDTLTFDNAPTSGSSNPVKSGGVYNSIEAMQDLVLSTDKIIDSFNANNNIANVVNTAPFVLLKSTYSYSNELIYKIKLKVKTPGVLSVGYTTDAIASGASADRTKVIITNALTVTSTGEQEIILPQPFIVPSNGQIIIGMPNDTCVFYYGTNGTQKGFYYVKSSANYAWSTSSIGVDFYGCGVNTRSLYAGKKLSILGDSISTYEGYIPEGNLTYYPSGTVQSVSDTWWYKMYTALGMTLDTNNSWSGSRVTTTAGETSAGCMTRCENLGNPDVIIVYMGINDFNNEVALGTYDGTTEIPSVTTTFREAYGIMLNKILTHYQSTEVWVATLPQCERNGETGFPEVNGNSVALAQFNKAIRELADAFGVKVLDHNKCGLTYQNMPTFNPDNLHPNKYGHSLIANNDINQLDNAIRKRYSII